MPKFSLNYFVAFLGLILAASVFLLLKKVGFSDHISWGAAIIAMLVVTVFWSSVTLGADDDEE